MVYLYFTELESHNQPLDRTRESEITEIFGKWLKAQNFKYVTVPSADSRLRPQESICPFQPDFLIERTSKSHYKIAVEAKGSHFRFSELLGQLLTYYIYFSEVWAVLPLEKAKRLAKIQSLIKKKLSFDFAIIGIRRAELYKYDETRKRFVRMED